MKQTLNTFSHKTLAFTILAASLSLPAFANAAEVSADAELSAGVATDAVKHHVVKHVRSVKQKVVTAKNGAKKAVTTTTTAATTAVDDVNASLPSISTSGSGSIEGNSTTSASGNIDGNVTTNTRTTTTSETTTPTPRASAGAGGSVSLGGVGASLGTNAGAALKLP